MMYQMTNDNQNLKLAELERQLQRLSEQVLELTHRIKFLERENNRRKEDVRHLTSKG